MLCKNKSEKGFSIVELLVVAAVIIIGLSGLLGVVTFSLRASNVVEQTNQANALAEELIEVVRNYRDSGTWALTINNLNVGVNHRPQQVAGTPPSWNLIQGTETANGFTRYIVFEKVSRDPLSKNIETVYNPANEDNDTKKVTATVSWGGNKQVQLVTYITNWRQ